MSTGGAWINPLSGLGSLITIRLAATMVARYLRGRRAFQGFGRSLQSIGMVVSRVPGVHLPSRSRVRRARLLAPECRLVRDPGGDDNAMERFAGLRTVAAALAGGVAGGVELAVHVALPLVLLSALGLGAVAMVLLDAWLARLCRCGEARVVEGVPVAAELIAAGLRGHHNLASALDLVAGVVAPPLGHLLQTAGRRHALGEPVGLALDVVASRTQIGALTRLADVVIRAGNTGEPLAPALELAADGWRAEAHMALERRAGRAAPVAALLTSMVIAPACVIFLVGLVVGAAAIGGGVGG